MEMIANVQHPLKVPVDEGALEALGLCSVDWGVIK